MSNSQSQCFGSLDVNGWDHFGLVVDTCCLHEFLSSLLLLIVDWIIVTVTYDRREGMSAARFHFFS
jgi:hypothetical protein